MKALTLTQPWATLVAIGAKRIETRSWRTPYRGSLAIHAAKAFPRWARDASLESRFAAEIGPNALPLGAVIATCRLISCIPTRELQQNRVIDVDVDVRECGDLGLPFFFMSDQEREFGDYAPGRWAWLLADVKTLPAPIPAKGALSLWEWEQP
jgi:hypothetical protein